MNSRVFNLCILLGWLMVTIGAAMRSISVGLIVGGALMLVTTAALAWFAGIFAPKAET